MKKLTLIFVFASSIMVSPPKLFAQDTITVHTAKLHFTLNPPQNWVNDSLLAQQFGLPCFLYPNTLDTTDFEEYFYALCIDKQNPVDSLSNFIARDIDKFKVDNPDLIMTLDTLDNFKNINKAVQYTFSNLYDNHIERVIYADTQTSFIVFSFAATTPEHLKKYAPDFERFIYSLKFSANSF